jgi:hypothetical protein
MDYKAALWLKRTRKKRREWAKDDRGLYGIWGRVMADES